MYILTCASCLVTKKCCLICASNQNTCFGVRCRVGAGVNSCGKLEKYSNNNVDTVFEILDVDQPTKHICSPLCYDSEDEALLIANFTIWDTNSPNLNAYENDLCPPTPRSPTPKL